MAIRRRSYAAEADDQYHEQVNPIFNAEDATKVRPTATQPKNSSCTRTLSSLYHHHCLLQELLYSTFAYNPRPPPATKTGWERKTDKFVARDKWIQLPVNVQREITRRIKVIVQKRLDNTHARKQAHARQICADELDYCISCSPGRRTASSVAISTRPCFQNYTASFQTPTSSLAASLHPAHLSS